MNAYTIAWREFRSAFHRPIAYIVLASFSGFCAFYTFTIYPFFVVNQATVRPLFQIIPFMLVFFVPAVAMGSIAEERRTGRLQLLQTWPIGDGELACGKFMGSFLLLIVALILTTPIPFVISLIGPIDLGLVVSAYLGVLLLTSTYLSISLLMSSLAQSQLVAFILGFFVCFICYVLGKASDWLPSPMDQLSLVMGFERRFMRMARGMVEVRDVLFFVILTLACLGLTAEGLRMGRRSE